MSGDGHANFTLLSGDVLAQTTTFSSASTLSGNLIGYESSSAGGNGTTMFPNEADASALLITASGSTLTGIEDDDNAGNVKLAKTIGNNTAVFDSNGRMTIGPNGSGTPVFYFASPTQGFAVEQQSGAPDNQGDSGLITLEGQTGGPFSCTSATGTALLGQLHPPAPSGVTNGSILRNGTTSVAATLDNSDPSGVLTQGQAQSFTCVPDQNGITTSTSGRFTYTDTNGDTNIGYAISATKQVIVNATPGQSNPAVIIVQQ
jgi:hypothetical protein